MELDSNSKGDYVALQQIQVTTPPQAQDNSNNIPDIYPLHNAAQFGKVDRLKELLLQNTSQSIYMKDSKGKTPLHWAASVGNHKLAFRCVKALLGAVENDSDKCRYIDIQDGNGETAVHLAAKNESKKITELLLMAGGDVNIKSLEKKEPMHLIIEKIPDVMVGFFDKSITADTGEPSEENLVLALNFDAIVGRPSESEIKEGTRNYIKLPVESNLLAYALHTSDYHCKDILTHPLVQIFLHLKWKKIRVLFYASIFSHIIWLILYTMFVVDVYLKSCPYISPEEALEISSRLTMNSTELEREERHAAIASSSRKSVGSNSPDSVTENKRTRFTWFGDLFSDENYSQEINCDLNRVNMWTVYILLLLTAIIAVKEVFEFSKVPKKIRMYFMRMENMGQWLLITSVLLTSWPVFSLETTMPEWQYSTAAFGIFLAWSLILSQIGKLPKLGIYVEMLVKVLKSFALFILTFASLLIAFALSLSILIPGKPAFSSLPLALLKVLIMMIGELNYDEVFHGDEAITPFPVAGHIIFAIFAIMVTIILINLLIGFTVSDIQGLQHDAEVSALSAKLEQIYLMESFLLSDKLQFYMGCCNKTAFLQRFLVTNPLDHEDMTVKMPIRKIPWELEKDVRRLAVSNMVQEEFQDVIDEKREKLKNMLKTITNEILAKWEF